MTTGSDSAHASESAFVSVYSSDGASGSDIQGNSGSTELYVQDAASASDAGYASFSVSPFHQLSYITSSVEPYFVLAGSVVALT
jgi:hypothetical protein